MGNSASGRRRVKIDEQFTRPQGLYPERERDVDAKKLRRLILEGKLAPCYPGVEDVHPDVEECPICFLHYPSLNRSRCCTKGICTECFLQMKSPIASRPTQCPFCKTPGYAVEYRGPKNAAEKGMEQAEEQRVIMATLRIRQEEQARAEERAKKREKDLAEGRVPEPPSPTLFPPPARTLPAFPPPAPTALPQSVNSPSQSRNQSSASDQGSADRSLRRRTSLNRRVTAIEPDNLWFRAGSAQASRRASSRGEQEASESSAMSSDYLQTLLQSTAESQAARQTAPPGATRASDESAEESGEGAMPILRALARSGPNDLDTDLDDVMLNEAIWLSIQEEEDRQRRGSQGTVSTPHGIMDQATVTPPETLLQRQGYQSSQPQTQLQTQGYEDPDEAATSELARAIAASLEENATWQSVETTRGFGRVLNEEEGHQSSEEVCLTGSEPTGEALNESKDSLRSESGAGVSQSDERGGSEGARNDRWPQGLSREEEPTQDFLGGQKAPGLRFSGALASEALGYPASSGAHAGEKREACASANGLLEVTSQADVSSAETPRRRLVWHSRLQEEGCETPPKESTLQSLDPAGSASGRLNGENSEASKRGELHLNDPAEESGKVQPHLSLNVFHMGGSETGAEPAKRSPRLPMLTQLRANSVYRSAEKEDASKIGAVEPLSLTQLFARKSLTGHEGLAENGGLAVSKSVSVAAEPLSLRSLLDDGSRVSWGAESSIRNDSLQPGPPAGGMSDTEARRGVESQTRDPKGIGAKGGAMELLYEVQTAVESGPVKEQSLPDDVDAIRWSDSEPASRGWPTRLGADERERLLDETLLGTSPDWPSVLDAKKRRARSLSGSSAKALETPTFSPVKYPPPRASVSQRGAEGGTQSDIKCRRSPEVPSPSRSLESPSKGQKTKPGVGQDEETRPQSDATYEEQLARAIALSLAETEAEAEWRKRHEVFEKEAFALTTTEVGQV